MTARTSSNPDAWGPSILAILADYHGLAWSPQDLRRLFGHADGGLTLTSLVQAAEAFGFETQAGQLPSYDDLKELPVLPAVVHLRRKVPEKMLALRGDGTLEDVGREGRFAVVHHADDTAVELEDPEEGRLRMPRPEFEAAWRGIVLCVAPAEEQEMRREGSLPARFSGWLAKVPPFLANVLKCVLILALGAGLAQALGGSAALVTAGVIAVALAASAWAIPAAARCAACAAAAREIGLPLAPIGILYYAGLLAALGFWGLVPLTATAIHAAAGVHLALLTRLAASRVHCRACMVAAVAAWAASGLALGRLGIGWHAAALPAAALVALLVVRLLARRTERLRTAMLATVREILTTEAGPSPGNLRLIVYKHETCPKCRTLEEEVLPPLANMLGERLTIERRPAGLQLPAPTVFFLGGEHRVAIIGLPEPDDLREALTGG